MNKDDIIRMAREAGCLDESHYGSLWADKLIAFAALVAAAEREKVAAWMIQRSYATGHGDTTENLLNELDWQIAERIAAEREACAKLCINIEQSEPLSDRIGWEHGTVDCHAAIRARGEK